MAIQVPINWDEIRTGVKAGNARTLFSVGDEIPETLTTGEEVTLVVAGIDVYSENEITFAFKNCLRVRHSMNDNWGRHGGYRHCDMRFYLHNTVSMTLPEGLSRVIKKRKFDHFEAALWLPSEFEVFGEQIYGVRDDADKQLPHYELGANRIKRLGNDGSACAWWERSPSCTSATHFCNVNSAGNANSSNASNAYGVAPCFLI